MTANVNNFNNSKLRSIKWCEPPGSSSTAKDYVYSSKTLLWAKSFPGVRKLKYRNVLSIMQVCIAYKQRHSGLYDNSFLLQRVIQWIL